MRAIKSLYGALFEYEGNVEYGQLAPRHLEAAAARPQLLLKGEYNESSNRGYIPGTRTGSIKLTELLTLLCDEG